MSHDTEKLEEEVRARRSSVESTIEELRSRMSVGQIFDELSGYLREGPAADMTKNLGRQVRDNPLALGLVGAGIAWLMLGDTVREGTRSLRDGYDGDDGDPIYGRGRSYGRAAGEPRFTDAFPPRAEGSSWSGMSADGMRTDADSDEPGLLDRAGDALSDVGGRIAGAAGSVSSAAGRAGSSAYDAAGTLGEGARRYSHEAAEAAWRAEQAAMRGVSGIGREASRLGQKARRTFVDTLQEEPLVIGAVALAIGAAIGASLPSTKTEDEIMGEARDSLRDQAYETGKEGLERAVNVAGNVASATLDAASSEAEAKGLIPGRGETLAEKVAGVARAATDAAKAEAKKEGLV